MVEHMETNSPDRESAARLLELADDARAATMHAAALPWWLFALEGVCAGICCGALVAQAWVVAALGVGGMLVGVLLLHWRTRARGQHLGSFWVAFTVILMSGFVPGLLREAAVSQPWISVGYGVFSSVVFCVVLLLDERRRNRRFAEGRFEEYDIW